MAAAGDVLAFADSDVLRALDAILRRRPAVVALERLFAATPRGVALINRIKADPSLASSDIRIISHGGETAGGGRRQMPASEPAAVVDAGPLPAPAARPAQPLDWRGTRRAPRHRMAGDVTVQVDGNQVKLIDLSTAGAQVVSPAILKPNQRVRVVLSDAVGVVRVNAAIAWASFEIPPKSSPQYRAGVDFLDADGAAVDAFCERHRRA